MTYLRPDIHVVRETPVAKLFRSRLGTPDIITFFSVETGQWILAYWLERRVNLVDEIEDLGIAFELVNSAFVNQIVSCWRPVNWQEKKRRILAKEHDRLRKKTDDLVEQSERYKWLQKRSKHPTPYAFQTPIAETN